MIQKSVFKVEISLSYDDEATIESYAQERLLEVLPSVLGRTIRLESAVISRGLVDEDGMRIN